MSYKRTQSPPKNREVYVEYRNYVTTTSPLEGRTYTMTHSDDTGDLFVTIGLTYAVDKTNELQDQVYLTWMPMDDKYFLYGEVMIDGENISGDPKIRNDIFRREMPLALRAIYVADQPLYTAYPELNNTPVLINFKSADPRYNKLYSYDTIASYNNK